MESVLSAVAAWLDTVGIGPWSRGSALVYPVANTLHLLGLVMLVGGIGIVDLRIMGLWRSLPIAELSRALTPVAVAGLVLMAASGTILFAADGVALARSGIFARKLVIIAAALANAAAFRRAWGPHMARWTDRAPRAARAMAGASLLLWLAAGASGRWIAYG
ncbi:DUF6644 family protein [Sphingopyxis indica]|uniref:DUF6644 domain-containing protein n=1 Tax=Sphingopyxis indica TaxID=436663 RepID=A0A239E1D8_9SPHN|nr:DUF6644 family protein [Sphingopyxis indica]WOF45128.1 hypothetical protein KNJ79_09760 [Sphingopyxis indica]SNS38181.1 hypothetical protein SAMN06295955_101538 [Sphingopyxis indica]